jgi:hypothetical protein
MFTKNVKVLKDPTSDKLEDEIVRIIKLANKVKEVE